MYDREGRRKKKKSSLGDEGTRPTGLRLALANVVRRLHLAAGKDR